MLSKVILIVIRIWLKAIQGRLIYSKQLSTLYKIHEHQLYSNHLHIPTIKSSALQTYSSIYLDPIH